MGEKSPYHHNVSKFDKNMDTFLGYVHDVDTFSGSLEYGKPTVTHNEAETSYCLIDPVQCEERDSNING